MQAVGTTVPEFDPIRDQPKAGPKGRSGNRLAGVALGKFFDPALQFLARGERAALSGSPGANLAAALTRREGGIVLGIRYLLDRRFQPYWPVKAGPVEDTP